MCRQDLWQRSWALTPAALAGWELWERAPAPRWGLQVWGVPSQENNYFIHGSQEKGLSLSQHHPDTSGPRVRPEVEPGHSWAL